MLDEADVHCHRYVMNAAEFTSFVHDVMDGLPEWVHSALDNLEIIVLDGPLEDDADEEDLLGLYVGVPLPERGIDYAGELPDIIYVYRLSHLALGLGPEALRKEIETTLVHEIAHYFGFDDERLHELGWG